MKWINYWGENIPFCWPNSRHIQLSCFGVISLSIVLCCISGAFCVSLHMNIVCLIWMCSFWYILTCTSTVSIFINISLLLHAWNCFSQTVVDSVTRLTHIHVVPFSEFFIHNLHAWSFTHAYTQYHLASTFNFAFSCLLASLGSLGLDCASPRQHCEILRGKAVFYSQEMGISSQWLCSSPVLRNSEGQWLLAKNIAHAVTEPATITIGDYTLCNSSSQQLDWTLHYVVPTKIFWPPNNPNYALCSLGS